MKVPQLVYGSSGYGRVRGYQLLGRSTGVTEQIAQRFCRWAPSHGGLQRQSPDACSWNWFQISDDCWSLARTVYGEPEYSGRGGLQVVTVALLLNRSQLAGYQNAPLAVAHSALTLGHLMLPPTIQSSLPVVSLPRVPFRSSGTDQQSHGDTLGHLVQSVQEGQHICVLNDGDPIDVLRQLYPALGMEDRLDVSFATGLKPSTHRDVQIQFLDRDDVATIRQQQRQNKMFVDFTSDDVQRSVMPSPSMTPSGV